MKATMRWFGPRDPVTLKDIDQAGATGVVTALHHIPNGQVWPVAEIKKRKEEIFFGTHQPGRLNWEVVESVPVHEDIKKGKKSANGYIQNYIQTLENLAQEGIKTVCYNFMPVLDWSRTNLEWTLPNGAKSLRFYYPDFAAFDVFVLKRPNARHDYEESVLEEAQRIFQGWSEENKKAIADTVLRGLPGAEEHFSLDNFLEVLADYKQIYPNSLRNNLFQFLERVVPIAEKIGIRLAIHPDDPPFPLLGLPRVVSTGDDVSRLLNAVASPSNGLCFCTGSFGARPDNDLSQMISQFANRVNFVHLRTVTLEGSAPKSFFEADHLEGNADLFSIIQTIKMEEASRKNAGSTFAEIPMRPDHGHQMLDDLNKQTNPGYSGIGRLKGLAALKGVEYAVEKLMKKSDVHL